MTFEEAAMLLAEGVRKLVYSPHAGLRHTQRSYLRRLLENVEESRKRKTGFERLMADDGEHLPGAEDATAARPRCKHCGDQFRPRHKNQKWCSTECRKLAYHERQRRIRHKDKKPGAVLGSAPCSDEDPFDDV